MLQASARKKSNPQKAVENPKSSLKNFQLLLPYLAPYKTYFIAGFVLLLLSNLTVMTFPYLVGKLMDTATGKTHALYGDIHSIALIIIGTLVVQAIFSYGRVVTFSVVTENAIKAIRQKLYQNMLYQPMVFFEKRRVGELFSRITADVSQLQDILSTSFAEFLRQIMVLLAGITIILITSTRLSLFMLLTFPVLIVAALFFGKLIRKYSKQTQDQLAQANTIVEETLQAIQIVKMFTNEAYETLRYGKALEITKTFALKSAKLRGAFISFVIFALFGGIVAVLWYGAYLVQTGFITLGELTSFILYTTFIGASVGGLGDLYSQIQKAAGATERVFEIIQQQPEPHTPTTQKLSPIKGDISFENVSFAYPTRPDVTVLSQMSFQIAAGETIALVGKSGAGKTTITQLLMRMYTPTAGHICVDNVDILDLSIKHLRTYIGWVPQDVILFGGTIFENIAYGNPQATEYEIIQAAKQAYAWEFIEKFPEGLQTIVGERGVKLSGGQKQRIAIARAILKNPPILILDEATSALDSESEKWVQQALNNLMKNRTTIIIAHRFSTIQNANRVFVVKNGTIVETGTPSYLENMPDSYYYQLKHPKETAEPAL